MASPNQSEGGRSFGGGGGHRPHVEENTLRTEELKVERKLFLFALKENIRGRFLRITEDVGGRRDHIIVPAPGLKEFARVIRELAEWVEAEGTGAPPGGAGGTASEQGALQPDQEGAKGAGEAGGQ